jgi:hypothetical protein
MHDSVLAVELQVLAELFDHLEQQRYVPQKPV